MTAKTKTMIAPSLGGTGTPYLIAQVRILDGHFHVQILAPNASNKNKNYGFGFDFPVTSSVKQTINHLIEEASK